MQGGPLLQPFAHFFHCRPLGDPPKLGKEIVGEGHPCFGSARLERAVDFVWDVADLDHRTHLENIIACCPHVHGYANANRGMTSRAKRRSEASAAS